MLNGKKILIGITGSIAAYKIILLVRLLVKEGAEVRVVVTPAAKDFVPIVTLSTLCGYEVYVDMHNERLWSNHVMLGRWADVFLIAPLSCNTASKMAHGICDNLLLAIYLSATCPVLVAPAMDEDMWKHKATQQNIIRLGEQGCTIIPVGHGELASGLTGSGRMAEPEELYAFIEKAFAKKSFHKKILITAGPTYEAIDPVRFIGNHSSGKMGIALAKECSKRGGQVILILGPVPQKVELPGVEVVHVTSASQMFDACMESFPHCDVAIMAAAVADFSPIVAQQSKIKKGNEGMTIELMPTLDILKTMGGIKKHNQYLVGFALETDNELENARLKLEKKNADMIVLNSLKDVDAGFGKDTNKITILQKNKPDLVFEAKSKQEVATDIIDTLITNFYA